MEMYGTERRKRKSHSTDRLSELPDEILCHILSFLPTTKASVATSILARRWRFVWEYVPNLHFDCRKNNRAIDRALVLHKLRTLKSFIIDLPGHECDEFQVETWIIAAIERNVQSIKLAVDYDKALPFRLFTCETLVDLTLNECGKIPTLDRVRLPRLKKLFLEYVGFEDDQSLPCLLSASPVLQFLRMHTGFNLRSCYISSSTLKWLCLEYFVACLGPRRDNGHSLEINTPALEYLSVHDYLSLPVKHVDLTSLIAADIYHLHSDMEEDHVLCCQSLLKFVGSLSNVKCLKLDLSDYATVVDSVFSAWTPSFNNLTRLELTAEPRFLSTLLQNANHLEILEFRRPMQWQLSKGIERWINPKQVPKCLLSCLRTIKVDNVVGSLKLVRYLLKNSKVLKRMDITYPWSLNSQERNDLLEAISQSERGSEACELAFVGTSHKGTWNWKGIVPKEVKFVKDEPTLSVKSNPPTISASQPASTAWDLVAELKS